jgi:hypothetical protein
MKATVQTLILGASLAWLAGCGEKPAPQSAAKEIKGTPINAPVAATPAAPAPAAVAGETAAPGAKTDDELPAVTVTPAPDTAPEKEGDYFNIGFDRLAAFNYEMPDESNVTTNKTAVTAAPKDQIPPTVRAYDKKPIALKGFMLPLKVEGGLITELLIMRDQSMCCYGSVPRINEWVSVKMTGKGLKPIMDQAVTLYGTLHVGEIRENGYLVGIYCMDGEKMAGPLDL